MKELKLAIGEPFLSPAWGSNLAVFSSETGLPVAESAVQEYLRRACKYAAHYGVYLVPERFLLQGHQCMCLIGPDGRIAGAQQALFLSPQTPRGKRGTDIMVVDTEFGGVALCVDVDIYRPEVARIAATKGAQLFIVSQFIDSGDYHSGMVLSGCWNAAQGANLFVVDTCNQFHCVCAPLALTPHKDGFLCQPSLKMPMPVQIAVSHLGVGGRRFLLSRKLYAVHRNELIL